MSSPATRLLAVQALLTILPANAVGRSLRQVLSQQSTLPPAERGLLSDLLFGVCRHYRLLNHWLDQAMDKPLKGSAQAVRLALLAGLYELWFTERPEHAVVNAWPDVCRQLKAGWASGLCNALLRRASRQQVDSFAGQQPLPIACSLPDWLWQQLCEAWPEQAANIARASLTAPPLAIRIADPTARAALSDAGLTVRAGQWLTQAAILEPARPVHDLPGFADGLWSVQDEAAQWPATLIDCPAGARVLDACAAPGGKTLQLLQQLPGIDLLALDIDETRLASVAANLNRAGQRAALCCGDAADPDSWWDGRPFDAVLLDAPCSASGILRRQPDIKWHRRAADIDALCGLQRRMLDAIWPLIHAGGTLVYATCSILPQENARQIDEFLARHGDAREDTPVSARSVATRRGCQLLPKAGANDGFFFARLRKAPTLPSASAAAD